MFLYKSKHIGLTGAFTERALSIVRYLIENKNINPNRISLKGYGEFNPIVPNDTPENKKLKTEGLIF